MCCIVGFMCCSVHATSRESSDPVPDTRCSLPTSSGTRPGTTAAPPRPSRKVRYLQLPRLFLFHVATQATRTTYVRAVYAGRPSRRTTASSFGQPPPTRRAKYTARYVRPSCVCRGWSDSLELTEQRSERSRPQHLQLRSPVEDETFSGVFSAPIALKAPCDNALYKFTLKLTLTNCSYSCALVVEQRVHDINHWLIEW